MSCSVSKEQLLETLYQKHPSFFLSRETMEGYFSKVPPEKLAKTCEEIQKVFSHTTLSPRGHSKLPLAIIVTGNHASFQKEVLDAFLQEQQKCTPISAKTNLSQIQEDSLLKQQEKAIAQLLSRFLMVEFIERSLPFSLKMRASHESLPSLLSYLDTIGYQIKILHITNSDATASHRETLDSCEKIANLFLKHAKEIEFYLQEERQIFLTARWNRNTIGSAKPGTLHIFSTSKYETIKDSYEKTASTLQIPSWQEAIEDSSFVYQVDSGASLCLIS